MGSLTKKKMIDYHFKQPNATLVAIGAKFCFKSTMPADLESEYRIIASAEINLQTKSHFLTYKSILQKKLGYTKVSDLPTGCLGVFRVLKCVEKEGRKGPGDKYYMWTVEVIPPSHDKS